MVVVLCIFHWAILFGVGSPGAVSERQLLQKSKVSYYNYPPCLRHVISLGKFSDPCTCDSIVWASRDRSKPSWKLRLKTGKQL